MTPQNPSLKAAKDLAAEGFPVFPTRNKKPLTRRGLYDATTDTGRITEWWAKWPDATPAIPTGKAIGAWILDVDRPKKEGDPDGFDTIRELTAQYGSLAPTRMQMTPGGGAHYFFKMPSDGRDVRNSVKKIAPGLDIRGTGGYVCYYGFADNFGYAEAPGWLRDLIGRAKRNPAPAADTPAPRLSGSWRDSPYTERAVCNEVAILAGAPSGTRNETLNEAAFSLGRWIGGGYLGEGEARDMLIAACSANGLIRDDGPDAVRKTIDSGLNAGIGQPREIPEREHGGEDGTTPDAATDAKPEKTLFPALTAKEILELPPQSWAVKGVLPDCGVAAIFGPSRSGKTFIALSLIAASANGMDWFGWKTKPMDCLYIALESVQGLRGRLTAVSREFKTEWPDSVKFMIEPFNLLKPSHVAEIIRVAPKGGVLAIDTLNRATPGADENSSKDMSLIIEAATKMQRATGGLVILVSHTGKDAAKGLRGHSSLIAALDSSIEVGRNGDVRFIKIDKVKEGEDGAKKFFRLKPVIIGRDGDGEDVTSCVVEPLDESQAGRGDDRPLTKSQEYALETLVKALRHEGTTTVRLEAWRKYFYEGHTADNEDAKRQAFLRARSGLVERKKVYVINDSYGVTIRDMYRDMYRFVTHP